MLLTDRLICLLSAHYGMHIHCLVLTYFHVSIPTCQIDSTVTVHWSKWGVGVSGGTYAALEYRIGVSGVRVHTLRFPPLILRPHLERAQRRHAQGSGPDCCGLPKSTTTKSPCGQRRCRGRRKIKFRKTIAAYRNFPLLSVTTLVGKAGDVLGGV